jgi:hypothetical protein
LAPTKGLHAACEVLNYEAPFGVGYLVAQITNAKPPPSSDVELARTNFPHSLVAQ